MCYPRRAHPPRLQDEDPSSSDDTPATIEDSTTRFLRHAHTSLSQNEDPSTNGDTAATTEEITIERNGLADSPFGTLPQEMRLMAIQPLVQNVRKIAVVPKAMAQKDSDDPISSSSGPSLFFATKSPLLSTCYHLNTDYTSALKTQINKLKVPTLILYVLDFDFSPITRELLSTFKDEQRKYYNSRAGAINIRLKITDSFFARAKGERERLAWLAQKSIETTGLSQWLAWRAAEKSAGREISVTYKVMRNASIESIEDREALRLFILLFDPQGKEEGDVGEIVEAVAKFFNVVKKATRDFSGGQKG